MFCYNDGMNSNMELLCQSANVRPVYFDSVNSHTATHFADKPSLREIVAGILVKKELSGPIVIIDEDIGEPIGVSDVVEIDETDEIVYAMRILREEQGYVPFTKSRAAQPCSHVSMHLVELEDNRAYELASAWIGEYESPPFPGDAQATAESRDYWSKRAFVWGSQTIIPGTELSSCPW